MSEASKSFVASPKHNTVGPDYFGFYTCEVAELLSQDDNSLLSSPETPGSSKRIFEDVGDTNKPKHDSCGKGASSSSSVPLFSNCLGTSLSEVKRENLKALLRQSLGVLSEEVDEVLHPVIAMQNLQSQLRRKRSQSSHPVVASDGDAGHLPQKKLKVSISKDMDSGLQDMASSDEVARSNDNTFCTLCSATETSQWTTDPKDPTKSLCKSCTKKHGHGTEPVVCSKQGAEIGASEVDSDLQYLLESDSSYVEEIMRKYSDEYFATLEHMEKKLEELLDTIMSKCRPMTLAEKQQLRKLIQNLPAKNLDRVVEIIQSKRPSQAKPCQDLYVDLEKEDNVTLWRLYYYVEAVENAKKLAA